MEVCFHPAITNFRPSLTRLQLTAVTLNPSLPRKMFLLNREERTEFIGSSVSAATTLKIVPITTYYRAVVGRLD